MTTPVGSSNSTFYDPNAQLSSTEGYPRTSASSEPAAEAPREITVAATVISGDAGAQHLLKQHDAARRAPDCGVEAKTAGLSCAKAGITAAQGVVISSTGVGMVLGAAATLVEAYSCGRDLRTYYDCRSQ
jgi:hypothetical protein